MVPSIQVLNSDVLQVVLVGIQSCVMVILLNQDTYAHADFGMDTLDTLTHTKPVQTRARLYSLVTTRIFRRPSQEDVNRLYAKQLPTLCRRALSRVDVYVDNNNYHLFRRVMELCRESMNRCWYYSFYSVFSYSLPILTFPSG